MTAREPASASDARTRWRAANHRYLVAAIAEARARLEQHARGDKRDEPTTQLAALAAAERELASQSALEFLCERFGLSRFERHLVVLCAGADLDSGLAAVLAGATGDTRRPYPTFGLALAALPEPHWDAITPDRPLRRYRLIEPIGDEGLTRARLRLEERVLHFLTGIQTRDERLLGVFEPLSRHHAGALAPSHRELAQRIAALWSRAAAPAPLVQLCGVDHGAKEAVLAAACSECCLGLFAIRAGDVPLNGSDRDGLARLWDREAMLSSGALLIHAGDSEHPEQVRAAVAFAERASGFLAVSSREPWRFRRRVVVRFDVERPSAAEQAVLWRGVLGPAAERANGQIGGIVAQFSLSTAGMHAAAEEVRQCAEDGAGDLGPLLWDACRGQARPRMDDLAQRIVPAVGWDDIVLPPEQLRLLHDIAAHVRQRAKVYEQWGFGRRGSRGLGITALFAGASGTGKTLAAEVIAAELRLDLYRVDLSQVVSKYIGETEKNLRRIFDAAEEGGAVLLFDEADALFGKRSEVKDSHDRYANLEVSYLLQRMEAYRGLAILTTNVRNALDTAFLRRLRFVVEFPFPGPAERAEIWRRIFPPETPTDALDVDRLARLNVPGGVIRNIALNAAFVAAEHGEPVRMSHLQHAASVELVKLERPLSEADLGGWT